jgi:hypothetical protein
MLRAKLRICVVASVLTLIAIAIVSADDFTVIEADGLAHVLVLASVFCGLTLPFPPLFCRFFAAFARRPEQRRCDGSKRIIVNISNP